MLELFKEEFKHPLRDANQFLIGCILYLVSFLIIPWVLIYGYIVRIYRNTLSTKDETPSFSDLKNLSLDGLKSLLISFVYLLPPLLISIIIILSLLYGHSINGSWPSLDEFMNEYYIVSSSTLIFLRVLLTYIGSFFIPMAIAHFAKSGLIKKAFDLKSIILSIHKSLPIYLLIFAFSMTADYLTSFMFLNYYVSILQPIVSFYLIAYTSRLFAKVYKTTAGTVVKHERKRKL